MKFHHRWAAAALFVVASGVSTLSHAAPVSGQGTWETTLQGRDLDGNLSTAEAYYDTSLNITWLADANAGAGSAFDDIPWNGGSTTDGLMTWSSATAWAAGLNPYGSNITGWRLPTTNDVGNDGATYTNIYQGLDYGYNITAYSEMSHMFYTTLGDKAYVDTSGSYQPDYGLTNTGPFSNVQSPSYWSATEHAPDTSQAWYFNTADGSQDGYNKIGAMSAWAVHSGDVGAAVSSVPVPAAVWLFSSGLAGLIGFARRKKRTF